MTHLSVLLVEDDADFRASTAALISREGYETREAGTIDEARKQIADAPPDLVLLDLVLPDGEGLELLAEEDLSDRAEFVIMTGHAAVESAVTALREGALDYLPKPVDRTRLQTILANVARTRGLKREVSTLRDELRQLGRFGNMVGRSVKMQAVYDLIAKVAPTESSVFVTGESGTGKELVAETVHRLSKRGDRPFFALNCGAVSSSLIESELFGHEKGSFTGADRDRRGFFEEASGGTLFLDEVSEMPIELQVKLLRVLESGTVTRVGSTTPIAVDVRVVAASNRDPREAVAENVLREDLLYRLNVFPIELPPLRDREDDIALLSQFFLDEVNRREGTAKKLSDKAVDVIRRLPWPGNVRELKNAIERSAILADDTITPSHLPGSGGVAAVDANLPAEDSLEVRVGATIADAERRLILATLESLEGDKKRAAAMLGISLKTLYNRLNVYEAAEEKSSSVGT